ncbi:Ulp1 peptidase [Ranunculus cassubicifolius]
MGGGNFFSKYLFSCPFGQFSSDNSKKDKTIIDVDPVNTSDMISDDDDSSVEELDIMDFTRSGEQEQCSPAATVCDLVDDSCSIVSDSTENEDHQRLQSMYHEAFFPLTQDEEDQVSQAFSDYNRDIVLVTHEESNIEITGEVFQCLKPRGWLNDEVINLYLQLLKERENRQPERFLKCHFFNALFYKRLTSGESGYDFKSVRRWTSPLKIGYNLIECDKLFVPIHKEMHWFLGIINKKDEKFQYLDSLKGMDAEVLDVLARYYVDEVKDKTGEDIDVSSWKREYADELPAQKNWSDCGMFMIKYIDFYSRGLGLFFDQGDIPYFRKRTAKEILRLRAD